MVLQLDRFGKQFHTYVLHILPGSTQCPDFCRHRVLKRNPNAIARSGAPASQQDLFEHHFEIPLSANWSTEQDAKQSPSTNGCCGLWLALRRPASQEAGCCSRCGQPWHTTGYLSASRPGWARSLDGRLPAVRLQMSPGLGGNPITWHSSFLLTWQQTCMENVRLPLFLYGPLGSHNNF
jgi:hypothetical protein